jgi:DNA polymerase-4
LPYFISDKGLILETVKELLYQERMKDSVRLAISLNNLNTEESCRGTVKIFFSYVNHLQQ